MMKRGTKRLLVTVMASTLLSTAAFTAMATKSYAEQEKTQTTLKGDTDGDGKSLLLMHTISELLQKKC